MWRLTFHCQITNERLSMLTIFNHELVQCGSPVAVYHCPLFSKLQSLMNAYLKVIRWINPKNLKLLSVIDNDKLMGMACSKNALWRNKVLASGLPSLPDLIE